MAFGTVSNADSSDDFAYMFEATLKDGITVADLTAILEKGAAAIADFDCTLIWDIVVIGDKVRGYQRFENEAAFFGQVEALGDTLPKLLGAWTTDSIVAETPLPKSIADAPYERLFEEADTVRELLQGIPGFVSYTMVKTESGGYSQVVVERPEALADVGRIAGGYIKKLAT